ncbi:MAG TPA: methyltransferase domain-containing protein [Spirochaetia bacterium]|nr:methyltransferase domain-containing protein [Spirochaetia bacterium]
MMEADVHHRVQSQFGAAANAYTLSVGHSDPALLKVVLDFARARPGDEALDIATGAGHTAMALSPHVSRVTAYDITPQMLEETARNAAARGLRNVVTRQGPAEKLPFADASFDIVTVRQAPHHFADIRAAIFEMARVARPGARVVVVDSRAPEDPEMDRAFNAIEKLRDPSHVRNYRTSEWRLMLQEAGLDVLSVQEDYYTEKGQGMDFDAWTRRINTAPAAVEELRRIFRSAGPALVEALRIERNGEDIRFCVPQVALGAMRPAAVAGR